MQGENYRKFDANIVPWFLVNRPHSMIMHALDKIGKAKNADFTGIQMTGDSQFKALSFDENVKKVYELSFGDAETRPNCTCLDFQVSPTLGPVYVFNNPLLGTGSSIVEPRIYTLFNPIPYAQNHKNGPDFFGS